MAVSADTVWRIRQNGSDTNGAGFDSTTASAGSDLTQQDAAQLSVSDLTSTAATTMTSVTGGFTAAMIGNYLRVSAGTGATTGYYRITAVTNTNTITVDRVSGTYTDGVGKVGGAAATLKRLYNDANATGDKAVPGNIIYVRGSGEEMPTADDYTDTGSYAPVQIVSSRIKIIGENGRPRLSSNGRIWTAANRQWLENIYFTATGNTNASSGMILPGSFSLVRNCVFDTQNRAGVTGVRILEASVFDNNLIFGLLSGTPTAAANSHGLTVGNYTILVSNNTILGMRGNGMFGGSGGGFVQGNIVHNCAGDGINFSGNSITGTQIENNTINANQGHGIYLEDVIDVALAVVRNNIISNHTTSGKYGIYGELGTLAQNDFFKRHFDYNWFYNNDSNYGNITAGANDTPDTDPGFVDVADLDFTAAAVFGAGWPGTHTGTTSVSSREPGAVQTGGTTEDIDLDLEKILRLVIALQHDIQLQKLRMVR